LRLHDAEIAEEDPMPGTTTLTLADRIRDAAHPLATGPNAYDTLMQRIGDAHYVLLGEASHGTHEFYRDRVHITQRLVTEKGFTAVATEADWPDAYRIDRYVRGKSNDASAVDALGGFRRFPAWMWRNDDVVTLIEWLREHNAGLAKDASRVGFYGLDLYSLRASMEAVVQYLDKADAEAARRVRERYACFDHFRGDDQVYGFLTGSGASESCQQAVVDVLVELRRRAAEDAERDANEADDDLFDAEQNARVAVGAEAYYRTMYRRDASTWNLRDTHMVATLEAVVAHLARQKMPPPKVAVWAHNSHLGDASATEMGQRGEVNVGQLVRARHGADAVLVGFTTHHGRVTAASEWGGIAERKHVRPALRDSFEATFHETRLGRFLLTWREGDGLIDDMRNPELERAIGVIYRPETERQSHYFWARLADQFDVIVHTDETRAVRPLEPTSQWEAGEPPETFPFGV
jgi:erythromycin esterase-like protein